MLEKLHLELLVVFLLQLPDALGLLASVGNFFEGSLLLELEHPHSILELFHVLLNLNADRLGLVVGQVVRLNIDDHVLQSRLVTRLIFGRGVATVLTCAVFLG